MEKIDFPFDAVTHLCSEEILTPINRAHVESIRECLSERHTILYNSHSNWLTDHQIILFLIARNFDIDATLALLLTALKWRDIRHPDTIQQSPTWNDKMSKESETGKIYCPGHDQWGRPVIILDNTVQNTNVVDDQMNFLAWNLEFATQLMPKGVDKYLVFVHLKNFSLFTVPPFAATRETIHMLCNCYPERLGHCIVYQPPAIFRTFFNTVKVFLDPKTVSKLVFVVGDVSDGSENDSLMRQIIGQNWKQLTGAEQPVVKAGSSPGYDHQVYWPTVLDRVERLTEAQRETQKAQSERHSQQEVNEPLLNEESEMESRLPMITVAEGN